MKQHSLRFIVNDDNVFVNGGAVVVKKPER
jgi:hypothetical protein